MEAMAMEQLVLRAWELNGYWGRCRERVPPRKNGHWREIDVVAVKMQPNGKACVRFGETKVQNRAQHVFVVNDDDVVPDPRAWLGGWSAFCDTVAEVYWNPEPSVPGLPHWDHLERLELVLVFNGWLPEGGNGKRALELELKEEIKRGWTLKNNLHWMNIIEPKVMTTFDVIIETINSCRIKIHDQGRGCRFGDPFLDATREILRYLHSSTRRDEIREDSLRKLFDAFGISPRDVGQRG